MSTVRVMIVDDLKDWRTMLSGILKDEGYLVEAVGTRSEALHLLNEKPFHAAIIDVRLFGENDKSGLELARDIRMYYPTVSVIFATEYASVEQAIVATREYGAINYIDKKDLGTQEGLDRFKALVATAHLRRFRCFKTGDDCVRVLEFKPRQVFVAMPYRSELIDMTDVYELGIAPAVEEAGLQPLRADDRFLTGDLMCNICYMIRGSSLGVIDITGWNANVLLELGLMYGFGKPAVLLKHERSIDIPADLRGILYVEYGNVGSLKERLLKCFYDLGYVATEKEKRAG